MKKLSVSRRLGVGAVVLALTLVAPADAIATPSAPAASEVKADKCGNHTHYVLDQKYRYWGNCINKSEKIKVDFILWWDSEYCVAAGSDTSLGTETEVRGASRVGDC